MRFASFNNRMRILAIDFGRKRIGLAVCDETQTVITPLPQLDFTNRNFWANLKVSLGEKKPHKIILGYPYQDDGKKVTLDKEILEFKQHLQKLIEIEIELVDERFTSKIANEVWMQTQNTNSMKKKKEKKKKLDSIAAAVMLRSYISKT